MRGKPARKLRGVTVRRQQRSCAIREVFLWLPRFDKHGKLLWGRAFKYTYDDGRVEYSSGWPQ